ncbi:MAG: 50S ribosomal protein L18 [Pseudomonadota bacterium]|uniref:Large ribosomal subunit protein uL18 n=1 Tax=Parasphingorhabdus marina DSM 22363 TaxID=1123272 RepID=A0A1N6D7Y9_9SPHN|nr:50S ribosomal protein L18 [Parasphingorhabdus marina]SIN66774.1 LSU ribosomal protein L18P [Parasphingorhabdus marina DSM 22363]
MANISQFKRRQQRVRSKLRKRGLTKPRLSVHRTSRHMYAQIIDDAAGTTVAAASTLDKSSKVKTGADSAAAADVGKRVAEAAKKAGVKEVIFDRGGFLFHGRVKALADAAREGGLEF